MHLLLLGNLALAQPLYDLLGRHAEFFVARGSQPTDIWLFVAVSSLAGPLVPVVLLALARVAGRRVFAGALATLLVLLGAVTAAPLVDDLGRPPAPATVALALVAGLGFAWAYRRFEPLRLVLTVLSPAILIFPAVFLLTTPVEKVAFPDRPADVAAEPQLETDVVFVVFDMLPTTGLLDAELEIDAARFPGFARLAASSTWYRRAVTAAKATNYAVPALLTGRVPAPRSLPVVEDHPQNLFTLLGSEGGLLAFESATRLCPPSLCPEEIERPGTGERVKSLLEDAAIVYQHLLLPEAWTGHLPPIDTQWYGFEPTAGPEADAPAKPEELDPQTPSPKQIRAELRELVREEIRRALWDDRLERFELFLERLGRSTRPRLSYLHLNLPHGPYLYLPSGRRYVPSEREYRRLRLHVTLGKRKTPGGATWSEDEYLVRLAYQRFIYHLELADALLDRLIDRLRDLGIYDDALIVVAADHGQSYRPGEQLRTMADADTVHVPLFIKLPHQTHGTVDDSPVSTIDVLPTLVDALDLEVDWAFDGFSLIDPSTREERAERVLAPELVNRLEDGVALKLARLGSGKEADIYRRGAHADLLGRRVEEIAAASEAPPRLRASLHLERLLRDVDPASGFVPAFLTGDVKAVEGEVGRPYLAIAINGIVEAVSPVFEIEKRGALFAALLPEDAFQTGHNRWSVHLIEEDPSGRVQLLPTALLEAARPPRKAKRRARRPDR